MRIRLPGPKTRSGRRLAGFFVLSLSAHAAAFSLFRDPGEFAPIPPPSPGKVVLVKESDLPGSLAEIFDPSAIVYPGARPARMTEPLVLPWQDTAWPVQSPAVTPDYRPGQIGADAPLAVRAEESLGQTPVVLSPGVGPVKGRPVPETWFEITGNLKGRAAVAGTGLPAMRSANALEPTMARIGVDEDGAVRFVFLEGTSGDPAVDREATQLLRAWRFEPTPGASIQWGRVRVLWAVESPANGKP
jgi:TonB family protein